MITYDHLSAAAPGLFLLTDAIHAAVADLDATCDAPVAAENMIVDMINDNAISMRVAPWGCFFVGPQYTGSGLKTTKIRLDFTIE